MRHKEQVELIKHGQDFILDFQCKCFSEIGACPKCGGKIYNKEHLLQNSMMFIQIASIARMGCTCGWTQVVPA